MTECLWNKFTAEAATLGRCESCWEATGISFDTRKINKGDLFIALPGKRDGHDFVKRSSIILPDGPIKEVGEFEVNVELHPEIVKSISIEVKAK